MVIVKRKKPITVATGKGRVNTMEELSEGARSILDSLADGAYVTDTNRRILFWNRAAEEMLGWNKGDVLGRCCGDNILIHVDKDGHQLCLEESCPLHRSIVTGRPSEEPVLLFAQHKEGGRVPVEVTVAPILDESGEEIGGIELFRDMTLLMRDLMKARMIQEHALECRLEDDPRVGFATLQVSHGIVGGDFYRAVRLNADEYALMIADVMGHGIASALYCMQMRALWDELEELAGDPGALLTAMNSRLHRLAQRDLYFATAAVVVLDVSTGMFRYAMAGHPPLLVLGGDGGFRKLTAPGMALGLMASVEFEIREGQLLEGESLLMYTDGALELIDESGGQLGMEGLVEICRKEGLPLKLAGLRRIEERLLTYSDELRFEDDLTMLAFSRLLGGE